MKSCLIPVLALTAALGGCGPERGQFAPACPVPGLVRPLDELTRARGGSADLRDLAVHARIMDVTGRCKPGDDQDHVNVTVQIAADATRGPGMAGDSIQLPAFIAVTEGDTVLDKRLFYLNIKFPSNIDTARGLGPEINLALPVTPRKSAAAYSIIAGFQLTPEEVAAARRNMRR